ERYRVERDKRIRPEGAGQYIEPAGRFAYFLEDPWVEAVERESVDDEVTVALVGGGFAGLLVGAALREAGIDDIRIIDSAGGVGGVWYWNRYPGAMCDTAAMVYLPLLEETGYMPSAKYVEGHEILGHARRIAEHWNLCDNALFSTQITALRWDDGASRWLIETNRGDRMRARFVSMGTGPLNQPKLPGIPGIETFGRKIFHTSRWEWDWTGGTPEGDPMTNLADKRVGIIGTGATGVQVVPRVARDAEELFVFQRTPSSIDVRANHPIDPDEFAALEPGWQREWYLNFATLQTGGFADDDFVKDGWTDIAKRIRDRVIELMTDLQGTGEAFGPELILRAYEDSDDEKMNEIRARVDEVVEDQATAAALKPWYRQLCKRPCFHDEYLQAYNRPNVHLVDTDGQGVERIDESGVWVAGECYELDCLVLASGFEVDIAPKARFDTVGLDGLTLEEHWAEGMRSLHGTYTAGFPNLFVVGLSQGANLISNITNNHAETAQRVAAVVSHCVTSGAQRFEATAEAEQAWVDGLDVEGAGFIGNADCTPGYYNNEGRPAGRRERLNGARYPEGPIAFFNLMHRWRTSGEFEGLAFS
ncbi:MAG: flavin-containing monooxygenase, partial [Microthrixaceae bacterium]